VMKFIHSLLLSVFTSSSLSFASTYFLSDNVVGPDFYHYFDWEAIPDPTHGRVNYVDQATSIKQNLTYASQDTFILRTDFQSVLNPNGTGRNSVRIRSKKTFTTHVAIFDVRHMPQGCGTWPAIWETKESIWPNGGEIDILEGVNDQGPNRATLHTGPGCQMPSERFQTGQDVGLDCDALVNGNAGCSVSFPTNQSYGPPLNDEGGGWFAVERTDSNINIWFWSRCSLFVPYEVKEGLSSVNPLTWGLPTANFPNTLCNMTSHFSEENIIINLTLCGDWAGNHDVYQSSGCPSTCVDFVNNNPASFKDAYFDFASIRTFTETVHNANLQSVVLDVNLDNEL